MNDPNNTQTADASVDEYEVELELDDLRGEGVKIDVDLSAKTNRLIVRIRPRRYLFST